MSTTRPGDRPSCGTVSGYWSHRYHGEPYCDPCRVAHREHRNARRIDVPLDVFALMYLNLPVTVQRSVEERIGADRIDRAVTFYDKENT